MALNAGRDLLTQASNVIVGTVTRSDRRHRPPRAGQPAARPAPAHQPPHRQTRHLQIPGQRPNINRRSYKATLEINILARART
jgi:hypothetical protein